MNTSTPVGELAAAHPQALPTLDRYRIDYCCHGERTLADACAAAAVDPDVVLAAIRDTPADTADSDERWDLAPLSDLVLHLLAAYHRPLDDELPRLEALARKVHRVHGDKEPELLADVLSTFVALRADLEQHMLKEERILFPMITAGDGALADGPIEVMCHEHDQAGHMLRHLRDITQDYAVPDAACASWTALWRGLEAFETSLHRHIHLENNILFPRALGG